MAVTHRQRLLLPIILVILLAASVLFINSRRADATPTYPPLITDALKYEGQHGGECYIFMQKVVQEVTGRYINGDYRQSYLDAGATEVPLPQAESGDIIQLANDKNTAATASYPGLHTTLVMENHGDGSFKVIDSNYLYDGVVRVHDDYDPLVSAARYQNISVHVYRLPAGRVTPTPTSAAASTLAAAAGVSSTPAPDETPEVRDEPLEPGTMAVIAADGDCLRLRDEAGLEANEIACPPTGALVRILDGAEELDGYRWQLIQSGPIVGWVADRNLEPASATVSASAVDAQPQATPSPTPTPPPPPPPPTIASGEAPPPEGGVSLFVFSGGTYEDLLAVSGCDPATATFWVTNADGQLVWYLPAVTVAAVNAPWQGMFSGDIPAGTALMGRCA
jgi:hypothetical protein